MPQVIKKDGKRTEQDGDQTAVGPSPTEDADNTNHSIVSTTGSSNAFLYKRDDHQPTKPANNHAYEHVYAVAEQLLSQHAAVLERLAYHNGQDSLWNMTNERTGTYETGRYNWFESTATSHQKTWFSLQRKGLHIYEQELELDRYPRHSLALLLARDDDTFIEAIDSGDLPLGDEIGFIAIQRLKHIIASTTNKHHRKVAKHHVQYKLNHDNLESIFQYNNEALRQEIVKLINHALNNPHHKVTWLGSAWAMDAAIQASPKPGAYFDPEPANHTWQLNRAWLQAAASMGYEFRIMEQFLPNVEKAILSGDPAELTLQLAKEIRSKHVTSPYTRGDSPTATPQEVLLLLDMGYQGHKNDDGSISLRRPCAGFEQQPVSKRPASTLSIKRRHSSPDLSRAAPVPPGGQRFSY